MYFEDGMYREFGRILKQEVDVPIILAGRMDNPELAEESIGTCCDIISYGRPLLADVSQMRPYPAQSIRHAAEKIFTGSLLHSRKRRFL